MDPSRPLPVVTSREELEKLFEVSREVPVILFKHSLSCGTSFFALDQVGRHAAGHEGSELRYALLEIQPQRALSDAVAERTGVRHQSPQVLLLRDGRVVWSASHYRITIEALDRALEEATATSSAPS